MVLVCDLSWIFSMFLFCSSCVSCASENCLDFCQVLAKHLAKNLDNLQTQKAGLWTAQKNRTEKNLPQNLG